MRRKPMPLDWITVAAAGVAGLLTGGFGSGNLSGSERLALGVTVGLATAVVLHVAVRLLRGKRRGL
jgi:hypothetical protein